MYFLENTLRLTEVDTDNCTIGHSAKAIVVNLSLVLLAFGLREHSELESF